MKSHAHTSMIFASAALLVVALLCAGVSALANVITSSNSISPNTIRQSHISTQTDGQRIANLEDEVAQLQAQVDALSQAYQAHTHHLRLQAYPINANIVCDANIVAAGNPGNVCHGSSERVFVVAMPALSPTSLDTTSPNR